MVVAIPAYCDNFEANVHWLQFVPDFGDLNHVRVASAIKLCFESPHGTIIYDPLGPWGICFFVF